MKHFRYNYGFALALLVSLTAMAHPASAETLTLHFTGLDFAYDGNNIFDAGGIVGSSGDPADADALGTIDFFLGANNLAHSLDTDIFADFLIPDVGQIPLANTILDVPATGVPHFGFDLLTSDTTPGFGLNLEIDAFTVVFLNGQLSVSATGNASVITEQDLGEFAFDENQPVTIFFGSSQLALTHSGGNVDSFTASGAGHVSGTFVPEPSTVAMLAMGILGLLGAIWRPFVVLLGPACPCCGHPAGGRATGLRSPGKRLPPR